MESGLIRSRNLKDNLKPEAAVGRVTIVVLLKLDAGAEERGKGDPVGDGVGVGDPGENIIEAVAVGVVGEEADSAFDGNERLVGDDLAPFDLGREIDSVFAEVEVEFVAPFPIVVD